MTKKDYELIAHNLLMAKPTWNVFPQEVVDGGDLAKSVYATGRMHAWQNTCKTMADGLRITNPLFDKQRFLKACGITE